MRSRYVALVLLVAAHVVANVSFLGGVTWKMKLTIALGIHYTGQIIATSHDQNTQKVAVWKGNGTPYFREI